VNILLSPEKRAEVCEAVYRREPSFNLAAREIAIQEALCRAQVRKVAEWAYQHNAASPFEAKRITVRPRDILLTEANIVAALKAAGGG
jgi:hypothetical protein